MTVECIEAYGVRFSWYSVALMCTLTLLPSDSVRLQSQQRCLGDFFDDENSIQRYRGDCLPS